MALPTEEASLLEGLVASSTDTVPQALNHAYDNALRVIHKRLMEGFFHLSLPPNPRIETKGKGSEVSKTRPKVWGRRLHT
jgi:hypothetical protein